MVGGGGGGVKPNRCVEVRLRLGWGFDNTFLQRTVLIVKIEIQFL